ncbi:MAG: PQQ-binding-like beta-propeller repeat protein [Gaiellales bacterium]
MSRRAFALAALACSLIVAGCGVNHHDIVASTVIPTPTNADVPNGQTTPADRHAIKHVEVVVLDRQTSAAVVGAIVTLGASSATTDVNGVASFRKLARSRFVGVVSAKGYDVQRQQVRFRPTHRFVVVRVWRPGWSWPVYGGDAERTQSPAGISLTPKLRQVWGIHLDGLAEFPPVTAQGIGYVTTATGTLTAFDTQTGDVVWRRKLDERMGSSPGVADGRVFVVSFEGQIRAFDALNGRLLWQKALGAASESSPQVVDGRLLFAAADGRVRALDPATGKALWVTNVGAKVTMAVTAVNGLAIVGDYSGKVHALDQRTGKQRWQANVGGQLYAGISAQSGRLFVASSTKKDLTALRESNGKELWQANLHDFAFSGPAVAGNVVVNGSYDGHVRAFRATDGSLLWDVDLGDRVYGTPQIVNGVVWVASFTGRTDALALASGRRLQQFPHGRYAGISGDEHTLLLLGFSRIWGLR